ncbi:ribonuclease domain-containing protein [Streptomyces sp. GS7]|uniref:ribonuclease domain-containing protein n=1 Tax=Streptomyces sp. GS7 TaxID=2692234 RepID=UPI0013162E86|nr:ribonuclease domain-containing protein [Streptomyces sp. GS7]QHC24748.1 ribonuclease [Streptomyces sp. GS7]
MRIPPRITKIGAAGALASALLLGGTAVAATPAVATTHTVAAHVRTVDDANDIGKVCYSQLPDQAHDTLNLIDQGGPFPYPGKDGSVFTNTEGVLPAQSAPDYYHEYTVITPGAPTRGARRIVTGEQPQEDYYTADHYKTFNLVDRSC